MSTRQVSVTGAKAQLSAMVEGALHEGERHVIERRGEAVAALVSIADLERLTATGPGAARPRGALALVGLWGEVQDEQIDALVADRRSARERDTGRSVELPG